MLKTGIYTIEQIETQKKLTNLFGADKRISITLYNQVLSYPNAEKLAERILLMFTDERGAYKRTYSNRFEEFDRDVLSIIQNNFQADAQLVINDVAVSDGRTALDFFNKIASCYTSISYSASDYSPVVYVIHKGKVKITLGQNHNVIEIVWPPFVFNSVLPDRYWYEPLNRFIQFFVEKFVAAKIIKEYQVGKLPVSEIFLFAPSVLKLANTDERFKLLTHDLLQPFTKKSNIIRAMNILNPGYFSKNEFTCVIDNLFYGLEDNGMLIVGSNQGSGSTVNGGVYQKTANGFCKIWQSGIEPYIERQLLNYSPQT